MWCIAENSLSLINMVCFNNSKQKMSEPIINWEAIVHKNVRSSDGVDVGNVAEVNEKVVVIQGVVKEKEYNLPHSAVDEFDGAEVRLNIPYAQVQKFRME
jgi:hypothetical protein